MVMREFKALVAKRDSDGPWERVTLWAETGRDAIEQLKVQFGEDLTYSVWNEEDANRPRWPVDSRES